MILNKFSSLKLFPTLWTFGLHLLALSLFSCNKTANINANKSFIGVTHVAYGIGPITVSLDGTPLFPAPLGFGLTSGDTLNPYDTTVSRISDMVIQLAGDSAVLLNGNAAFQQGEHYSAFVFDSTNKPPLVQIIFQDNPSLALQDTQTNVRYLNFSPGPSRWSVRLVNTRNHTPVAKDTITFNLSYFVGNNLNPASTSYGFTAVRIGNYQAYAFRDSVQAATDSANVRKLGNILIDSLRNYNMYLQGFADTPAGANKFQLKSFPLN